VTDSGAGIAAFAGLRHLEAVDALIDLSAKGFTDAMDQVLAIAPNRADFRQALQTAMHNSDEEIRDYAKDCLEEAVLSKSAEDSSS
jgi:fructose-1-phosphate kinase PfkB-like protein